MCTVWMHPISSTFFLLSCTMVTSTVIIDINECTASTDTCEATVGVWFNIAGSFTCSCPSGYTGDGTAVASGGTGCTGMLLSTNYFKTLQYRFSF